VRACETSTGTYRDVASHFDVHVNTRFRWVQRARETGTVAPFDRGGGWRAPVDLTVLHRLVSEHPDRTTDEVTGVYNAAVARPSRVYRSSILRELRRTGCLFKKHDRGRSNRIVRASKPSDAPSAGGSLAYTPAAWCFSMNQAPISPWDARIRGCPEEPS
jgi:transposase